MEVIDSVLFITFLSICLGLTFYQTYVQFNEYARNEDSASIEYRKFNQEEKDLYPAYSICFYNKNRVSIAKYMKTMRPLPSKQWRRCIHNHAHP